MPPKVTWFAMAALSAWLGCADDEPSEPNDASVPMQRDAGRDAMLDATPPRIADASADANVRDASELEPRRFVSTMATTDDGEILIEKVAYLSDGLRIFGQVCRPNPSGTLGAGPFPVHIINHGGFSGLGADWNGGNCATTARRGWVVAESSYRGEDDSEGKVEVCLGEVSDVLKLTEIVRAQPYADSERVMMSGLSHGGCITLRALQRGAPVQLAVDIFGPTDWATAYASWKEALANGTGLASAYQGLISALDQATGGDPDAYDERSPLHYGLDFVTTPLLIVQGTADAYVPPTQPCTFADASFDRYHVGILGNVSPSAPAGCTGSWLPGPRPSSSWPKDRYLIVYDDVGHNFEGLATSYLIADMTAFLSARFPP